MIIALVAISVLFLALLLAFVGLAAKHNELVDVVREMHEHHSHFMGRIAQATDGAISNFEQRISHIEHHLTPEKRIN